MSDAADEFDFYARQLLNKSKTNPLRERMRQFVADHGADAELETVRVEAVEGDDLSKVVIEDRDERL